MRQLDPLRAKAFLDAQQAPGDQPVDIGARHSRLAQRLRQGPSIAIALGGQQLLLDEQPQRRVDAGEARLVELPDDLLLRALEQIRGDLRLAEADALIVELAADDAEQGRLDLDPRQLRLADCFSLRAAAARGNERDHFLGHTRRHQVAAGGEDGIARLPAVHPRQTHAVFHDRRHPPPQAFEIGQEILAQGEDHPATLLAEIVAAGGFGIILQSGAHARRRAVLDQSSEFIEPASADAVPCPKVKISSNWSKTSTGVISRLRRLQNSVSLSWK